MSLVKNLDNIFDKDDIGRVRKAQEDSHAWDPRTPNGPVFVVCDGMGGHVGGAKASSIAVESIINNLKENKYDNPLNALNASLQFANMQIRGFANDHPEYKGMGTTACVLLLQSDGAYYAHVGDSRIYLYLGKEKKLHRITKDHSYVQSLVDKGIIDDDQAETHSQKNRILKALGVTQNVEPTFNSAQPKNGDIFLICSDGLCGMIPDRTIETVLGHNTSLAEKGELLIKLALQGETVYPGGQDNCTLELIQIDNSSFKESKFTSFNPSKSGKKNAGKKTTAKIVKVISIIVAALILLVAGIVTYQPVTRNKIKRYKDEEINLNLLIDSCRNEISSCQNDPQSDELQQRVERDKTTISQDSLRLITVRDSVNILTKKLYVNTNNRKNESNNGRKK